MNRRLALGSLVGTCLVSACSRESRELPSIDMDRDWFNHGPSLALVGDADGDGLPDLALGEPFAGGLLASRSGRVSIIGSRSWSALFTIDPGEHRSLFGWCLCPLGPEGKAKSLAVGRPGLIASGRPGRVDLVSIPERKIVASCAGDAPGDQFGYALAPCDSETSFLASAPNNWFSEATTGAIYRVAVAESGMTRKVEARAPADSVPRDGFGCNLLWLGDAEFAAPAAEREFRTSVFRVGQDEPVTVFPGTGGSGYAYSMDVLHLQTGLPLLVIGSSGDQSNPITVCDSHGVNQLQFSVEEQGANGGISVLWIGDVDGDGSRDFAVGAPGDQLAMELWSGQSIYPWGRDKDSRTGAVYVVSSSSMKVIGRIEDTSAGSAFGVSMCRTFDVDHDGCDEIVVGCGSPTSDVCAWIVSVKKLKLLQAVKRPG